MPVIASAQKRGEFVALGVAQFYAITYIRLGLLAARRPDDSSVLYESCPRRTKLYGQARSVFGLHLRLHTRARPPPAEADLQRHFGVSPPSVHQMVLTLERAGFIRRQPRTPRSIELLIDPTQLPDLL